MVVIVSFITRKLACLDTIQPDTIWVARKHIGIPCRIQGCMDWWILYQANRLPIAPTGLRPVAEAFDKHGFMATRPAINC